MAVYTPLQRDAIEGILARYEVGRLLRAEPIAEGVENTNYFVDTERGRYVLTLFERVAHEDLPFFLEFMRHLAARGIPCPDVVPQRDGALIFFHAGKAGCLITRLPGRTQQRLDEAELEETGRLLARMHLAATDFPRHRPSPTGLAWLARTAKEVRTCLRQRWPKAEALLWDELAKQRQAPLEEDPVLPKGVIHGDLFVDNLLFAQGKLSGVIDFYYAHTNAFVLDLAIAANALALPPQPEALKDATPRLKAFFAGYEQVRPLEEKERERLEQALRLAALRFWVSRLFDACFPRQGEIVQIKDPEEYRAKLAFWRSLQGRAALEAIGGGR